MTRTVRKLPVIAAALAAVAVSAASTPASAKPEPKAPKEFVALSDVDPTIIQEMRYATEHDFVGEPIDGYKKPMCILTEPAAKALHKAQQKLRAQGYSLKVYDCYRPQRAVDHFVRWAKDLEDQRMKAEFYPHVDKTRLFADGYIAEKSGHSRGSTVDLTVVKLPAVPTRPYVPGEPLVPCYAPQEQRFPDNSLDMGTGFDCLDFKLAPIHGDHTRPRRWATGGSTPAGLGEAYRAGRPRPPEASGPPGAARPSLRP